MRACLGVNGAAKSTREGDVYRLTDIFCAMRGGLIRSPKYVQSLDFALIITSDLASWVCCSQWLDLMSPLLPKLLPKLLENIPLCSNPPLEQKCNLLRQCQGCTPYSLVICCSHVNADMKLKNGFVPCNESHFTLHAHKINALWPPLLNPTHQADVSHHFICKGASSNLL